jgi:hypothetical protein
MSNNDFEKLKERHEEPAEGCMFYVISFLGMSMASIFLALGINWLIPSKYLSEIFSLIFFFGFAGLAAWESSRADKRYARIERRLWLKYDYPSLLEQAESGDEESQYWIGWGARTHGCASECGPPIFWMLRAAKQGHRKAQEFLIVAYRNGEGIPVDLNKSAYWAAKVKENSVKQVS